MSPDIIPVFHQGTFLTFWQTLDHICNLEYIELGKGLSSITYQIKNILAKLPKLSSVSLSEKLEK